MIQVKNLTKYYGDLAAIKDVSFNVDSGTPAMADIQEEADDVRINSLGEPFGEADGQPHSDRNG